MTCEPTALRKLYASTHGYCDCCRRKLAFSKFATPSARRGAWDLDANTLRPVCSACLRNHRPPRRVSPPPRLIPREKPARQVLAWRSMIAGGLFGGGLLVGGLFGGFAFGVWGWIVGGLVGGLVAGLMPAVTSTAASPAPW